MEFSIQEYVPFAKLRNPVLPDRVHATGEVPSRTQGKVFVVKLENGKGTDASGNKALDKSKGNTIQGDAPDDPILPDRVDATGEVPLRKKGKVCSVVLAAGTGTKASGNRALAPSKGIVIETDDLENPILPDRVDATGEVPLRKKGEVLEGKLKLGIGVLASGNRALAPSKGIPIEFIIEEIDAALTPIFNAAAQKANKDSSPAPAKETPQASNDPANTTSQNKAQNNNDDSNENNSIQLNNPQAISVEFNETNVSKPSIKEKEPSDKHNEECPFCSQKKENKIYVTYPGNANDSTILSHIMNAPCDLTTKQPDCFPKNSTVQPTPDPILQDGDGDGKVTFGRYSSAAHHLISGKEALNGEAFEDWICASWKIESPTGYSINNADNGIWCPSIPDGFKKESEEGWGLWGDLKKMKVHPNDTETIKQNAAFKVMIAKKIQFHAGPHHFKCPLPYDVFIKERLKQLNNQMHSMVGECPICSKKEKLPPNVVANDLLDQLSKEIRGKITGNPAKWEIFISKLAMELHNKKRFPEEQDE